VKLPRKKRNEPEETLSRNQLEKLGASILKRYNDPAAWIDGDKTGKAAYRGSMIVRAYQVCLRRDSGVHPREARHNHFAVLAFTKKWGITDYVSVNQGYDFDGYIVVRKSGWERVKRVLKTL
jgi:hypothetical protein